MADPLLSVCVCTADRATDLAETLACLARARPPEAPWEVVVVDNRPGDGAVRGVLERTRTALPLVAVDEPRPGLSHARNRAVATARGAVLLFTDDDVSVDARWLEVYAQAARGHPDVSVFGGPIRPRFEGARAAWVRAVQAHVPTSYAWLDPPGPVRIGIDGPDAVLPFGANFAVRAEALGGAPFDPTLGRRPGTFLLGGEETQLLARLIDGGARGLWLAEAPVVHRIDAARTTGDYQRRYWYGVGWSVGVEEAAREGHRHAHYARHIGRRLRAARRRWALRGWWRGPAGRLPALRDLARLEGRMAGFETGCEAAPAEPPR